MSRNLKEAKDSVILNIKQIFKDNNFPKLPMDEDPIQGDLSIICFPGAQILKKSPEEVAEEVSTLVSNIKFVKKVSVVKAFCNIILDWDSFVLNVFTEISNDDYGKGISKNEIYKICLNLKK